MEFINRIIIIIVIIISGNFNAFDNTEVLIVTITI